MQVLRCAYTYVAEAMKPASIIIEHISVTVEAALKPGALNMNSTVWVPVGSTIARST